ncbi:MAG: hypothetical protein ACLPZR_14290 [Solirubrobacteraceae bacterium]
MRVTNLSRGWVRAVVDVPLAVGVGVARANELLRLIGTAAFEDPELKSLFLGSAKRDGGIESFAPGQVNALPFTCWSARSPCLARATNEAPRHSPRPPRRRLNLGRCRDDLDQADEDLERC